MKKILISFLILFLVFGTPYFIVETSAYEEDELDMEALVSCLEEEGVVIYGVIWCPACGRMVEDFGGYEVIDPIYIDCSEEVDRCRDETRTPYFPEIQIKGDLYTSTDRDPLVIAKKVGCEDVAKTDSEVEEETRIDMEILIRFLEALRELLQTR